MPQGKGRKCSHLPGCLILDKLLKDPVGLGSQLGFRPGLFEVLTCQPEVKVLLAELCLQEGVEGSHSTCEGREEQLMGQQGVGRGLPDSTLPVSIPLGAQTLTSTDFFLSLQANSIL